MRNHDHVDHTLRHAHREVEESRLQVERSLEELEHRVRSQTERVQTRVQGYQDRFNNVMERFRSPERLLEGTQFSRYLDRGNPFGSFAVFLVAGFLLGSWIAQGDRSGSFSRSSLPMGDTTPDDMTNDLVGDTRISSSTSGIEAENLGTTTLDPTGTKY